LSKILLTGLRTSSAVDKLRASSNGAPIIVPADQCAPSAICGRPEAAGIGRRQPAATAAAGPGSGKALEQLIERGLLSVELAAAT
jgi:hypothetical protein